MSNVTFFCNEYQGESTNIIMCRIVEKWLKIVLMIQRGNFSLNFKGGKYE